MVFFAQTAQRLEGGAGEQQQKNTGSDEKEHADGIVFKDLIRRVLEDGHHLRWQAVHKVHLEDDSERDGKNPGQKHGQKSQIKHQPKDHGEKAHEKDAEALEKACGAVFLQGALVAVFLALILRRQRFRIRQGADDLGVADGLTIALKEIIFDIRHHFVGVRNVFTGEGLLQRGDVLASCFIFHFPRQCVFLPIMIERVYLLLSYTKKFARTLQNH